MRRLADLKLEKEFGIEGDGKLIDVPASQSATPAKLAVPAPSLVQAEAVVSPRGDSSATLHAPVVAKIDTRTAVRSKTQAPADSVPAALAERDLEQRAASQAGIAPATAVAPLALPAGMDTDPASAGPLEAIALYDKLLEKYPKYPFRDRVLYQKARAYDELGQTEAAMEVMDIPGAAAEEIGEVAGIDAVQLLEREFGQGLAAWRDDEQVRQAFEMAGLGNVQRQAEQAEEGDDGHGTAYDGFHRSRRGRTGI